jgi:AraC-like DNA-binding protein
MTRVDESTELVQAIRDDPVLRRLDAMARQMAHTKLIVLLPAADDLLSVHAIGGDDDMPDFCRLVQTTAEGRRRCLACRTLITLRTAARGACTHACHSTIQAWASPAGSVGDAGTRFAVVTTCAFRPPGRSTWTAARESLGDLGLPAAKLRIAYRRLPLLTALRRDLVQHIVNTAAEAVAHIVRESAVGRRTSQRPDVAQMLESIGPSMAGETASTRSELVVDTIRAILLRNPGARVSIKAVADAAGLTPNHLSAAFRRHAGQTFVDFVTTRRLQHAETLLRDPRISVADVAARAGFEDAGYFSRRFRQRHGMTPQAWRTGPPSVPIKSPTAHAGLGPGRGQGKRKAPVRERGRSAPARGQVVG